MKKYEFFLCKLSDIVGFIKPGSLGDRLPRQGLAQADSTQLMGRPRNLKQQAKGAFQSPTGRTGRRGTAPARRLLRPTSPIGALASDSSRLWTASPIGRPGPSTTSDSNPASPTRVRRNPTNRSSSTRATRADWGHLTRDARSERTRGQTKKAHKSNHSTRDHTLYAYRNSTLQPP